MAVYTYMFVYMQILFVFVSQKSRTNLFSHLHLQELYW